MLTGLLAALVSGCAVQGLSDTPAPPPLIGQGPAVEIPEVELLRVTPRMHKFLEQYVLDSKGDDTRRSLLSLALTDRGIFGFHYNVERTLTAEEAFNTRSGNCIGFANLYIALAREAGLDARYHEVVLPPEWQSEQDTFIVTKHINVVIPSQRGNWQIEISGRELSKHARRRILEDYEARALYFNNLAIEALFEGDLRTAHAYLVKAIETAPKLPDPWSNLGVVLSRNEQFEDAELSYLTALGLDKSERTATSNLYGLYMAQERTREAQELERQVEKYRRDNPYYLLALSDEAIENQQFEESIDLLSRAIGKKNDEHRLHFAMARSQYLSGRMEAAEDSLSRARELAPEELREDYSRPLAELVGAGSNLQ